MTEDQKRTAEALRHFAGSGSYTKDADVPGCVIVGQGYREVLVLPDGRPITLSTPTPPKLLTPEYVSERVNAACNEVQERAEHDDDVANLTNLLVNAALVFVADPEADLDDVAGNFEQDDDEAPADVIERYLP